MKKILIIILAALQALLWTPGCVKGARSQEALRHAEEIMDNAPDSARKLLRGIEPSELRTRGDSALYHLLLTQAKYKCDEDIKADSIINFAADYFKGTDEKRHAMLSAYYSGIRYFELKLLAKAVGCYLEAEKLAKECGDKFYLGLLYESMVEVYKKTYDSPVALKYALRAREALRATDKYFHEQDASIYVAECYLNAGQYDQSIKEADSLVRLFKKENNGRLINWARRILGYALKANGRPGEAIEPLLAIMNSPESSGYVKDYRNLGLCYYMTGDTVSAMEWFSKIDPTKGDDHFIPWEVYADRGDYRDAFNSLRAEYSDMDRRVSAILRDNVNRVVTEFGEASVSEAKARAEAEGRQKRVITWTLAGALLLTAGGFIVYRRRKTARLREVMAMVDEQRLNVDQASGTTASDTNIEELFMRYKQRFGSINSLCDNYFSAMGNERKQKAALDAMSRALSDFRRDKGTLHELEECFNRCTDNLMARFREDFPDMTDADSLLMLLLFTGFSTSAICVMMGVKLQTLYNRKSVLRKIIEQSTSPLRDKYLSFCRSGK